MKYAIYSFNSTTPPMRFNCFFLMDNNRSDNPAITAIIPSTIKERWKFIGIIIDDVPRTNKILNILLPTIFPMARSSFPFLAAVMDVASSGSEVPKATTVRPIILLLIPISFAIFVAASTERLLPKIMVVTPKTENNVKKVPKQSLGTKLYTVILQNDFLPFLSMNSSANASFS